ncbi:30S ribosomal protein S8, partial [Candidatus Uhrbacteria bacterium]|nr:30S ribosomal protein S8 [Candidatus Uhrbacteria bacterium]
MAHTDPIADMLTRIRNSSAVKKPEVVLPYSKIKEKIALILKDEGYLNNVEVLPASKGINFQQLKLNLKYSNGIALIQHIKRISKPGQRVYVSKDELPTVLNNLGLAIVSTPRGLMTNKQA